ncbi:hypothetical protein OAO01_01360 [Oligoflexia bacterium]|nr:hypothetical protein [Oligoflexia bacterium]
MSKPIYYNTALKQSCSASPDASDHFRLHQGRPFTRSQRAHTTVLTGGLPQRNQRLMQGAWEALGYKVETLPAPDLVAYQLGKEFGNNGMCNPAYFTVGSLLKHIKQLEDAGLSKTEIVDQYVYLTAGSFGPCRFGMYEAEFQVALKNFGYQDFRVIILQQKAGLIQGGENDGLEINVDFCLGLMYAFVLGDLLNDIGFQIRPYEAVTGETDKVLNACLEDLYQVMRTKRHFEFPNFLDAILKKFPETRSKLRYGAKFVHALLARDYQKAFERGCAKLEQIKVNFTQPKPLVRIVGEFWAQRAEGAGNFHLFSFLEKEGCEVAVEPLTSWMMYMLHQKKQSLRRERQMANFGTGPSQSVIGKIMCLLKNYRSWFIINLTEKLFIREWNRHRAALGSIPRELFDQQKLGDAAHAFYHTGLSGGEGHLEVGTNILAAKEKLAHMIISVKPFGCLPSTQSDAVQSAVVTKYSDIAFLAVETSGAGASAAYSRIQMALSDVKIKAKQEFTEVQGSIAHTLDEVQSAIAANPNFSSAVQVLPEDSKLTGRAARFVKQIDGMLKQSEARS